MSNKRPSWNNYFMQIANIISKRSSCQRLHVGCVIVKDNHILSTGYNGFIAGCPHESIIENDHEQATVHAEQNAICCAAKFGVNLNNSTCYITHFPCIHCFKILVASGVKLIYYNNDYHNNKIVYLLSKQSNVNIIKI